MAFLPASDIDDPLAYEKIFKSSAIAKSFGKTGAADTQTFLRTIALADVRPRMRDTPPDDPRIRHRDARLPPYTAGWVTKGAPVTKPRGFGGGPDKDLLRLVLKHIRKYICDNRKVTLKGASAHALCATIAAAIAPLTGLPVLIVIGIVAAVIHFVLTVLKGVFCEMTDAKAVAAITKGTEKPKRVRAATAKKR